MNLGEFIAELKQAPPNLRVYIAPFNLIPLPLLSYRGYYEQLALGFATDEDARTLSTVGAVLQNAKAALNYSFNGYKGGTYLMTENTPVWLSNYGKASDMLLTKTTIESWGAVILTGSAVD